MTSCGLNKFFREFFAGGFWRNQVPLFDVLLNGRLERSLRSRESRREFFFSSLYVKRVNKSTQYESERDTGRAECTNIYARA